MNAFKVKPMKNPAFPNNVVPITSATTEEIPAQKGPKSIPKIAWGINSNETRRNYVSTLR